MLSLLAVQGPGLLLAALPAALILWRFYRMDRARPEPIGLIGKSVLYGFLAVAPAAALEILLDAVLPPLRGAAGALVSSFLVAGLVEESVKFLFVARYLFRRREFDERADGVVYAVCVSLGFAFVENFLYGHDDYGVLLLRAVTAVPLHAIATGVMGYYIGQARFALPGSAERPALMRRGLAWAVFLHGLYDFLVMSGGPSALLVLPLLVAGWRLLHRLYRGALAADDADPGLGSRRRPSDTQSTETR